MARRRPRRDAGVSDIVGTALVLAVTVLLVGAATLTFSGGAVQREAAPRLDLRTNATPAAMGVLTLKHAGGASIDRADLEAVVSTSAWAERVPLPGAGAWELGQDVMVPLPRSLVDGDRVEVMIVSKGHNAVLASNVLHVGDAALRPLPPGSFLLVTLDPAPSATTPAQAGSSLRVEAKVTHPGGRKAIAGVTADLTPLKGSSTAPLYDDGSHGDAVAGDLRYTTFLSIPPDAPLTGAPVIVRLRAVDLDGATTPATDEASLRVLVLASSASALATQLENLTERLSSSATVEKLVAALEGPPDIRDEDPFDPAQAPPNRRVTVHGENFSFANSVALLDAAGLATGVQWWVVDDGRIEFLTPPAGPEDREYRVRVTSPVGSDTSLTTFRLLAVDNTLTSSPEILSIDPTQGRAHEQVRVAGKNFTFATTVTLQDDARIFPAAFWVEDAAGTDLRFLVPPSAIPGPYRVVVNAPGGHDASHETFTVLPPPPPAPLAIRDIDPKRGVPYTEVRAYGEGFLDAKAVLMNGVSVSWWVVNDTEMRLLTHAGIALGPNQIRVFNATGFAAYCCFEALPDPNPREYSVYPKDLFLHAAHNTTKYDPGTGGTHAVRSLLKFELLRESVVLGGETMRLAFVTLVYQPLKPGDTGTTLARTVSQATCAPPPSADRVGTWTFRWDDPIPSYNKDYATLRYFYEVTWTNGKSGGAYRDFRIVIGSSDASQYFNLKPLQTTKVVNDVDEWPELPPLSYESCP